MSRNKSSIATHGVFIDHKKINNRLIKIKLLKLINSEILLLKKNTERKEILMELRKTLNKKGDSNIVHDTESIKFSISPQEWHWLKKHNENKWLAYMIYRYQFKTYPAQHKLLDFPLYLLIEPTSICNLRCIMCFQSDKVFQKKKYMGMMPWNLFKKLVDQARESGCHAITLASRGEPLLHRDFGKMLRYLKKSEILDIKINTNATHMADKHIHDILRSEVSEVVFSVDAATKITYEKIRRGGKFENVVKNIKNFHKIRQEKYPNSPTITRISGVKISDEQDIYQMSKFWSKIVDEVTIKAAIPRWDTYNNEIINKKDPCTSLWRQMYVWFDGTVNPCDFDYISKLAVGDAKKNTLKSIWQNNAFTKLRKDHMLNCRNKHIPCDRCPLS